MKNIVNTIMNSIEAYFEKDYNRNKAIYDAGLPFLL